MSLGRKERFHVKTTLTAAARCFVVIDGYAIPCAK